MLFKFDSVFYFGLHILVENFFLFSSLLHFTLAICCAIVRNGPYFSLYGVSNLHNSNTSHKYLYDNVFVYYEEWQWTQFTFPLIYFCKA